jgi:hypothetical protein
MRNILVKVHSGGKLEISDNGKISTVDVTEELTAKLASINDAVGKSCAIRDFVMDHMGAKKGEVNIIVVEGTTPNQKIIQEFTKQFEYGG